MHHVYILKSQIAPKIYVGETASTPEERVQEHNNGKDADAYTRRYRPWQVVSYIVLNTKAEALRLEAYLKTGAGRAFTSKYLLPGAVFNET